MKTAFVTLSKTRPLTWLFILGLAFRPPLFAGQSALSILGLGLESSPYNTREAGMGHSGMASVIKKGFSIQNPSKTAFNTVTSFEAVLETGMTHLQDDITSNRLISSRVPMIGGSFQLGPVGHLGILYFQRFEKNFAYSPLKQTGAKTESVEFEAGSYEIILSLARSLTPKYAFGLSYHLLNGEDRQITSALFENGDLINLLGDTLATRRQGGYFGLSFTYRHRKINAAFSASLPQKWEETKTRSVYLQQGSLKEKRDFRFATSFAAGIDYQFDRYKHFVLDIATDDWDHRISPNISRAWQAGLGYEYRGRGNPFDAYYKKMAYRAGAGYEKLYIHGVDVIRLTGGLGLPLGKRGSKMDLALELGRQGLQNNLDIVANYLKLNISLMGTGVWGRPSRRK